MKKQTHWPLYLLTILLPLLIVQTAQADSRASIEESLQQNLDKLYVFQNRIDNLTKQLDDTQATNRRYEEYKNVWLATMNAFTAATKICEYENDQLTLFLDLREKRRRHYYEVRDASLLNSVRQLHLMQRQVEISRALFPPKWEYDNRVVQIDTLIAQVAELLEKCRVLIRAMKSTQ